MNTKFGTFIFSLQMLGLILVIAGTGNRIANAINLQARAVNAQTATIQAEWQARICLGWALNKGDPKPAFCGDPA